MKRVWAASVVCTCLVGCNSASATPDAGPDATSDAPLADSAPDVAADAGPFAEMLLSSGVFAGGSTGANLVFRNFDVAPSARCGVVKTGACWVQDCRSDAGTDAPVPPTLSAGTLTLSKGTLTLITANLDSNGLYIVPMGTMWAAGDKLTYAASGDTIPAFTVPLTAPAAVTVTAPVADAGVVTLSHTSSLTVTWGSTTAPFVSVELQESATGAPATDLHIVCEYAGSAGTATVPASIVGMVDTGLPLGSVVLDIGGESPADVMAGGYPIHAYLVNATLLEIQLD